MRKPIIGIIGGIGSGKSFVASLFGELGARVIHADDLVHEVYRRPEVLQTLRNWWGDAVTTPDGKLDRRFVAGKVFSNDAERTRLEELVHPLVNAERLRRIAAGADDPAVTAFVCDTPLLLETGQQSECDAVVFVDAPLEVRLQRVRKRGWDESELERREKLQLPLDTKRESADYVISNAADAEAARGQIRQVFSRIQEKLLGN